MYLYKFGFYKYWKNVWEEEYYIISSSMTSEEFITRIKKALIENVNLEDMDYIDSKLEYIDLINTCRDINALKKINHWYQKSLHFSFKDVKLVN